MSPKQEEVVAAMKDDLKKKLDKLFAVFSQPALFLSEHFYEIRNSIDIEAEQILEGPPGSKKDSHKSAADINQTRTSFLAILKEFEQTLLARAPKSIPPTKVYQSLEKKVNKFTASSKVEPLNEIEEAYEKLALDLMAETNKVVKWLLNGQSVFYLPRHFDTKKLGSLVHLAEDYLTIEEIASIRTITEQIVFVDHVQKIVDRAISESLAFDVASPFVLTNNIVIVFRLANSLVLGCEPFTSAYFRFSKSLASYKALSANCHLVQGAVAREADLVIDWNRLKISSAAAAGMPGSIFETIDELDDSKMELENPEMLAKFTRLTKLTLTPSTSLTSLSVLSSLPAALQSLQLTVPVTISDISPLKQLTSLTKLNVCGPTVLGVKDTQLFKLSKELLVDLFRALRRLKTLALFFFEIECIDSQVLQDLPELKFLELNNNRITHMHGDAFKKHGTAIQHLKLEGNRSTTEQPPVLESSSNPLNALTSGFAGLVNLQHLNLDRSGIQELASGCLESLVNLNDLDLSNNELKSIQFGLFKGLASLVTLHLDHNPIESIQDRAFKQLESLDVLSLSHCKLKTLNNRMFKGLDNLNELFLDFNSIDCFQIKAKDGTLETEIKTANMTPEQQELVDSYLFCDLSMLTILSLRGNKFEKLDLNCFYHLTSLRTLDLSQNQINELNQQVEEENLYSLTKLKLDHNQLTVIPKHAFSESDLLASLSLRHNKLERFDDDFFKQFYHLQSLQLSNNNLKMTITRQTFRPSLLSLEMLDNELIQVADEDAFDDCPKLYILGLAMSPEKDTRLPDLPSDLFELKLQSVHPEVVERLLSCKKGKKSRVDLKCLMLTGCSIQSLDTIQIGKRFANLIKLDLSNNELSVLKPVWFNSMPRLEELNLTSNRIESLDQPGLFESLPDLKTLRLNHNLLKQVNPLVFRGLSSLINLVLSKNPDFSHVDPCLFRGLVQLKMINLSGNQIASLNLASLFSSCKSLASLHLSHNRLDHRTINPAAFSQSFQLKKLFLAHNQLEDIEFVQNLTLLDELDLSHNKIRSIESSASGSRVNLLARLTNLKSIDLRGNKIESFEGDGQEIYVKSGQPVICCSHCSSLVH